MDDRVRLANCWAEKGPGIVAAIDRLSDQGGCIGPSHSKRDRCDAFLPFPPICFL
ncbi:hypothetical protein RISK_002080 [Rhodopirellula islandica]|uniref:Uncharacterized protein n=1 Tax=Rhodopirellula islandica TaxID=595434 RepID=A0A0J1BFX7_RHOIS|nr:hypothetical protein RISK_002080 [Rhodopirellula islandica]